MKPFIENRKYCYEFYNSFDYQFDLVPQISFRYRRGKMKMIFIHWLWFGFYIQKFI